MNSAMAINPRDYPMDGPTDPPQNVVPMPPYRPPAAMPSEPAAKSLPCAPGVEKSVLSVILQFPETLSKRIRTDLFHSQAHRDILSFILEDHAAGQKTDITVMIQKLHDRGKLESVGGASAIADIFTHHPTDQGFEQLVSILENKHAARKALAEAQRIIDGIYDSPDDVVTTLQKSADTIRELLDRSNRFNGFRVSHHSEVKEIAEPLDFVEDLLTEGGASVLYGPSNCGKSFWIMDLAASVACGRAFRGEHQTDKGAVVYVCLEGASGLKNRLIALRKNGLLTPNAPFFFMPVPLSLMEEGHAAMLASAVNDMVRLCKYKCMLVVIDTFARAMAGGDENSGKDMSNAVKQIDAIRAATGAHVTLVHHSGKDEAKGARGHSALRAAIDTEIEVSRQDDGNVSTVRVTKQRDLSPGPPMPFTLSKVILGQNRRGKDITSCVVRHEDEFMAEPKKSKAGRKQEVSRDEVLKLLPQPGTVAWKKKAAAELGVTTPSFYRVKDELYRLGMIKMDEALGWERVIK